MAECKVQVRGVSEGAAIAVTCDGVLVFDADVDRIGTMTESAVLAEWLIDDHTQWTTHERGYPVPLRGTEVSVSIQVKSGRVWFAGLSNQTLQPLYTWENAQWPAGLEITPDYDNLVLVRLRYLDDTTFFARYGVSKNEVMGWIQVLETAQERFEPVPDCNDMVLRSTDGTELPLGDGWLELTAGQTLSMKAVLNPVDAWELTLPG